MKKNTIVSIDTENIEIELNNLNNNLETYLKLEKCFEKITGTTEIKTIEYLNTFITSISGFPNITASVQLLDFEKPYNFIVNNIGEIKMNLIDFNTKTVLKDAIDTIKEKYTYRLNDNAENDFQILKKIADLYSKLSNIKTLNAIHSPDYSNYNVNVFTLNSISQIR